MLTAAHFHFAGFGALLLLGLLGRARAAAGRRAWPFNLLAGGLLLALPMLALGIAASRVAELIGVSLYVVLLPWFALLSMHAALRLRLPLVARKLASLDMWLVASPAYLKRRGTPRTPAELQNHDLALMRANHGRAKLPMYLADGTSEELAVRAGVSANGFGFLYAAALAGGHIAMLPDTYAGPEVRSGRLVRVLPAYTVGTGNMFLVHPAAKVLPAKARAFRDFLLEHLDVLTQRAELEVSASAPASPTGRRR